MAAKICFLCNIRRPKTGNKGTETSPHDDMCNYCFEEGGWENTHSDQGHDAINSKVAKGGHDLTEYEAGELEMMTGCWICHPELNLAQKPAQASTGAHVQGVRRPQLNHKGHSHPATPAARRACKALFWAMMAEAGKTNPQVVATHTQAAMDSWDAKLDGFGKPLPAPKGGWAGVVPLTKAGKVSMKATQAKVDQANASK